MTCVPWDLAEDCCSCADWDTYEESAQERAVELAWATLRTLTGGLVGNCPVTVRPCLSRPCTACEAGWNPTIINGRWYNVVCGGDECSCERLCEITFPGPVAMIEQVQLGAEILDPDDYRLDDYRKLLRTDGGCWPSCQSMAAPAGSPDTLAITYVPGIYPGALGMAAAATLACEFAKGCAGKKCGLPAGVTSIVRQGVSMTLDATLWPGGLTGLREVDVYVQSVNPNRLSTPSRVWSPDLPSARHRYPTSLPTP